MDKASIDQLKSLLHEAQESLVVQDVDYHRMTAPCGLPCFACGFHLATKNQALQEMISKSFGIPQEMISCKGCRDEGGKCAHLPMPCRVYPCVEGKGQDFCYECSDFPCDFLHPYADRADRLPHNTKVFNLCLMKKMGLEAWAKDKASSVRDVYFWGDWTL
jgi:Protein of unknown function (DUF3795)